MKIILFDDSHMCCFIMQCAFEGTLHTIETYEDPGGYRNIIADNPPDVLILDGSMRIPGLTIIEKLKPQYPDVIFMIHTGDLSPSARQYYKEIGFAGIIHKPIDVDNIAPLFERILDGIDTFNISQ